MKPPTSFQDKRYPYFIRKSLILKAYPKPEKVFPRIGLKNHDCAVSTLPVSPEVGLDIALDGLYDAVRYYGPTSSDDVDNMLADVEYWLDNHRYDANKTVSGTNFDPRTKKILGLQKDTPIQTFIGNVCDLVVANCKAKDKAKFEALKTGKQNKYCVSPFGKNTRVYFSSDPWDIATMSMRGVSSCMRWSSSHSEALIGSVADPYTAIIYLSNGAHTKYGRKILARSVVRLVSGPKQKPYLLIENPYPRNGEDENKLLAIFQSYLESKSKLPIKAMRDDEYVSRQYRIPFTEVTENICDLNDEFLSLSDSNLDYGKIARFFDPTKVKILAKDAR